MSGKMRRCLFKSLHSHSGRVHISGIKNKYFFLLHAENESCVENKYFCPLIDDSANLKMENLLAILLC